MNSIDTLATFFGWCTIINIGFLLMVLLRGFVVRNLATTVFGVSVDEVKSAYMNTVMNYRNLVLVFSATPYIALKITA